MTTRKEGYALWTKELVEPTPEARRGDRTTNPILMNGFWRIEGARTKWDEPLAIWTDKGEDGQLKDVTIFQFGGEQPKNTRDHAETFSRFGTGRWLSAIAVTQGEWSEALKTGTWPLREGETERKPAREIPASEKLGIDTTKGENDPDIQGEIDGLLTKAIDLLKVDDPLFDQIKVKIEAQLAKFEALGRVDTMEKAQAAAAIYEALKGLGNQGEPRRKATKRLWDEGVAIIQARWVPILKPASEAALKLADAIQRFKDAEEARLRREAAEREAAERRRLAEAEAERLRQEAAARAAEIKEAEGDDADVSSQIPSDEEIQRQAQANADRDMAERPREEIVAPRVGTPHGRGVSKAKTKRAKIVDIRVMSEHFIHAADADYLGYMQKRADAAARGNNLFPGTVKDE